ncbi:CRISPR-associated endonuclease Cas1, partial [Parabacteroides merdae]
RDHPLQIDVERFRTISQRLKKGLDDIQSSISIDELRGIEGKLATDYYSIFDDMIINQKDDFYYHGRNRR